METHSQSGLHGEKARHAAVKNMFGDYTWVVRNLPGEQRRSLESFLFFLIQLIEMLDLESVGQPLDVFQEFSDELEAALRGESDSDDLNALADTMQKYGVSPDRLREMLAAVDGWIQTRQFATYEEVERFADELGGAAMEVAVPILGFVKSDYHPAARACGKAMMLTQLLSNFIRDVKLNRVFLAQEDIEECQVDLHRMKLRQGGEPIKHLVRLYCSRITKLFYEGGELVNDLDFDGRRTVTALLEVHWKMLLNLQRDPELVFDPEGPLSRRQWLTLKLQYVLGTEGKVPIIPEVEAHH